MKRFKRSNENRAPTLANEIQAPVKTIRAVNVGMAGWSKHDRVPASLADKTVRGPVIGRVGFSFNDDAAHAIDAEIEANQLDRDRLRLAVPEPNKIAVCVGNSAT